MSNPIGVFFLRRNLWCQLWQHWQLRVNCEKLEYLTTHFLQISSQQVPYQTYLTEKHLECVSGRGGIVGEELFISVSTLHEIRDEITLIHQYYSLFDSTIRDSQNAASKKITETYRSERRYKKTTSLQPCNCALHYGRTRINSAWVSFVHWW